MFKKKLTLLIAMVLVLSLALTGCSTKSKDSGATTKDTSGLKGELVYWSMWNETEPQAEVIKSAIEDFTKLNPGVSIKVQWNGRDIRKTLKSALDANQQIDMWDDGSDNMVKNYQNYLLKLDDYYGKQYPTTNGKAYKDSVMTSLVELVKTYSTDKAIYAVPYQPFIVSVMYNKDHFEKAGITSAPKTWEEFLAVSQKLKDKGFTPLTVDDAYMDLLIGSHLAKYIGEKAVEELVKDKTGAKWDNPAVKMAIKDYEDLVAKGYVSNQVATNKFPAGQQEVASGKVSMYLNGSWLPNEIKNATGPDFKWGEFAYPAVKDGVEGTNANIYGSQGYGINKNTKSADAAFAFIVFMTTGKWDKELADKTIGAPVGGNTEWPTQLADAKNIFVNSNYCYQWGAGVDSDPEQSPIVMSNFTKLLSGKIKSDEFLNNVKSKVK